MPPSTIVDANQSIDPALLALLCPLAVCHVVVYHATVGVNLLAHPIGLAQRSDEEADAFLKRDVDPAVHLLEVLLAALLDECVEPNRFVCQGAHVAYPLS